MALWQGTVSVTNGDGTVTTDSGPALSEFNAVNGSLILIDGVPYIIDSRTDATTMEIVPAYAGTTDTGVAAYISPANLTTNNLVSLASSVARTQAGLNVLDKNSQGLFFVRLGVTGEADPGAGNLAFDNADPTAATEMYVDYLDANTAHRDVSALLARFGVSTTIRIRSLSSTAYVEYDVAGAIVDNSGYFTMPLLYVGHDGTIGDGEEIALSWMVTGEGLQFDAAGDLAGRDAYDDETGGFIYMSNDGDGDTLDGTVIFVKQSGASGDWSGGFPLTGPRGNTGWSARYSIATDGARRLLQLAGWIGGEGAVPASLTALVGQYVSAGGFTSNIASAVDIRGPQGAPGADGDDGAPGTDGVDGVDGTDPGILLEFSDATADADPGAGNVAANSGTLTSATFLFISKTNRSGNSIETWLLSLANSSNTIKGDLILTSTTTANQVVFRITGITNASGYVKIAVTGGAGVAAFDDASHVSVQFARAGDQGSSDLSSVAGAVNTASEKAVPVASDRAFLTDSEASFVGKRTTLGELRPAIGSLAHGEEVFTDSVTVTAAMVGKILVADRATAISFNFEAAATLGSTWAAVVDNINTGDLTLQPDGSETINGESNLLLRRGQSALVTCNGTELRALLMGAAAASDDTTNVLLYGATGGGTVDDSAAIIAAEALGKPLVFPAGTYRLADDIIFSVPVEFLPGAKLSVDSTFTATFEGAVQSVPQVIFDGSGSVDGTFGDVFVFKQWFSSSITNASDILPRRYASTGPETITVGVDTTTVQEALDLIPLFVSHRLTIIVPSGVDTYELEDLIVPVVYQSFANAQMAAPSTDGGLVIIQSDDLVTPAYFKVGSIVGAGGAGTVSLRYIWTTKTSPYSDGSAIEARYGINFTVNAHKGDASNNGGGAIDRAYCGYYGGSIDIRAPIDLGTGQFTHAFVAKRNGRVYVNGYEDAITDVNMTGTVDYIAWPQGGSIEYPRNHQGSGDALAYAIAASKGGAGTVLSYDRANTIYPSARPEGQEIVQPFSWNKHTSTTENIAAGGALTIAAIPFYLPPRTAFCVRRIGSKFANGNLRVRIQKSGGTKWTAPADDLEMLNPAHAANVLIEDNNSTTVPVSGGLAFVIVENPSGSTASLSLNDYIFVEFLFTSPNSNEFSPLV